jgi:hypothetical protein
MPNRVYRDFKGFCRNRFRLFYSSGSKNEILFGNPEEALFRQANDKQSFAENKNCC